MEIKVGDLIDFKGDIYEIEDRTGRACPDAPGVLCAARLTTHNPANPFRIRIVDGRLVLGKEMVPSERQVWR